MKDEKKKFHETVAILVKAYLNNTLVQGHPCGCGVGNIIAATNGIVVIAGDLQEAHWENDKIGSGFDWYRYLYPHRTPYGDEDKGYEQIFSAGYTAMEFMRMERAFENVNRCEDGIYKAATEGSIFNGLMELINALAEIHCIDIAEVSTAKELFCKTL